MNLPRWLAYLDISNNQVTDFAGKVATQMSDESGIAGDYVLYVLLMRNTSLAGPTVLPELVKGFPSLMHLDVSDNPSLSGDLNVLGGERTTLLYLDVSNTSITTGAHFPNYLHVETSRAHRPADQNYTCYDVVHAPLRWITFRYDDACFNYDFCFCDRDFYGHVSSCVLNIMMITPVCC